MIKLKNLGEILVNPEYRHVLIWSVLISLTLLAILVVFSSPRELLDTLSVFSIKWFFLLLVVFVLLLGVVTARLVLALRLSGTASFLQCLDISIFHIMLLSLLPARLGDVCYPFILRQNLSIDIAKAVSNLLILRVYDLLTVFCLLVTAISLNTLDADSGRRIVTAVSSIGGILLLLVLTGNRLLSLTVRLLESTDFATSRIPGFLDKVRASLSEYNGTDHMIILGMTGLRWLVACLFFLCIFNALNIEINFVQAILVTTGINLAVLIPVQTMGGFGITEAVMAWFLGMFGHPVELAISLALASRLIWLIYPFLSGLIWIAIRKHLIKA